MWKICGWCGKRFLLSKRMLDGLAYCSRACLESREKQLAREREAAAEQARKEQAEREWHERKMEEQRRASEEHMRLRTQSLERAQSLLAAVEELLPEPGSPANATKYSARWINDLITVTKHDRRIVCATVAYLLEHCGESGDERVLERLVSTPELAAWIAEELPPLTYPRTAGLARLVLQVLELEERRLARLIAPLFELENRPTPETKVDVYDAAYGDTWHTYQEQFDEQRRKLQKILGD